jgi:hypothetical protein
MRVLSFFVTRSAFLRGCGFAAYRTKAQKKYGTQAQARRSATESIKFDHRTAAELAGREISCGFSLGGGALFTLWTSLNLAAGPVKQGPVSAAAGYKPRARSSISGEAK